MVIDKSVLKEYGCNRCVWRSNTECPKKIIDNTNVEDVKRMVPDGICNEYFEFLLGFGVNVDGSTGSKESLWERFLLYVGRLQSLDDYKAFKRVEREIDLLVASGESLKSDKLAVLRNKKLSLRLFWLKQNEVLLKGYSKVVDREVRVKRPGMQKLSVQQLNVLLLDSARVLSLEGEKEKDEREKDE